MSNILETKALNAIIQVNEMIQEKNFTSMAKFFDDLFNIVNTKINNQSLQPEYVEATYVGLHINETYEESDFLKMLEEFKNNKMIHAKYAMQIFKDAIRNLEKQPNVSNLDLNGHTTRLDTIIVGDLHGNFRDLYFIIQKFGVPGKKYRFVFNGDFVDRGKLIINSARQSPGDILRLYENYITKRVQVIFRCVFKGILVYLVSGSPPNFY